MAIIVTFDLPGDTDANDRARIRVAFERFGWEVLGGTAYRYPRMASDHPSDDWFNHIVPALMYFRCLTEKKGIQVSRFSIDAQSSGGFDGDHVGSPMLAANAVDMYSPSSAGTALSDNRLRAWLKDCADATAPE